MYESTTDGWSERIQLLTVALYRVTGLLPAGEPLRTALRAYANEVLAGCIWEMRGIAHGSAGTEAKIETLLGFLAVARAIPEVKQENFLVLEREYGAFLAARAKEPEATAYSQQRRQSGAGEKRYAPAASPEAVREERARPVIQRAFAKDRGVSERQRAILAQLEKTNTARVSDFYEVLRGVSPKTIQRDLHDLVSQNVLRKEGERKWTVYIRNDVS